VAALADFDAYQASLFRSRQLITTQKTTTMIAGRHYDLWAVNALAGVAPTTAVVPTNATVGSLLQENGGSEDLFALGASRAGIGASAGMIVLCDRLSHQGGLDGTVVTANLTTNLPTAALTRYTSGEGVMAGITIYTQIGTTATTITCNYTDEAGGSSTSPVTVFGGTGFREAARMVLLPLATGDTGVRAINNSTLALSTGTAGAFGYTLFKPLMSFVLDKAGSQVEFSIIDGGMGGGLPVIQDNACLFWLVIPTTTLAGVTGVVPFATV
jgi:hypothetical protein